MTRPADKFNLELPAADQQEELAAEAWEKVKQALETRTMTTKSGKVVELKDGDYVKFIQWLASQKSRKPRNLPPPRDTVIKTTD